MNDRARGGHYRIEKEFFRKHGRDLGVYGIAVYNVLKMYSDNHRGFPSYQTIAQVTGISRMKAIQVIGEMVNLGIVRKINNSRTPEEIKALICGKTPQEFRGGENQPQQCEWCKGTTIALQHHHYPIPKVDGGTETIKICANCHAEYHTLCSGYFCLVTEGEENEIPR